MPHWICSRPAASLQLMIRVAAEHGVSESTCVAGCDLTEEQLRDPAAEIAGVQELGALRNILRALGSDVPFALRAGLHYHTTTHGMWGFAIMSSATPRHATDLSLRYSDLSYSFNRLDFKVVGGEGHYLYDDCDNPDDLKSALVERDIGALVTFGRDVFGYTVPVLSVQLRGPRPRYAAAFETLFGLMPRFDAPCNCVAVDIALLDTPHPFGDAVGLRVCEEQCRTLLERRRLFSGIAGQVRTRMLRRPGDFPAMRTVAAELGMSTRTLRNQLAREATSYRRLLEQTRELLAEELLSNARLGVDEIAARLGYHDTSSFVSAFKRWKGVPPRGYARQHFGS